MTIIITPKRELNLDEKLARFSGFVNHQGHLYVMQAVKEKLDEGRDNSDLRVIPLYYYAKAKYEDLNGYALIRGQGKRVIVEGKIIPETKVETRECRRFFERILHGKTREITIDIPVGKVLANCRDDYRGAHIEIYSSNFDLIKACEDVAKKVEELKVGYHF